MLGDNIRRIRKEHAKISINKLSKISGVSLGYLSDLENNKMNPTMEKLQQIATALNVTVDEFFKENDNSKIYSPDENEQLSNIEGQLTHIEEQFKNTKPTLSIKEQEKLDKEAQEVLDNFAVSLSQNKDYLEDKDYDILAASIRGALEAIKLKNKEKYTTEKNKNKGDKSNG